MKIFKPGDRCKIIHYNPKEGMVGKIVRIIAVFELYYLVTPPIKDDKYKTWHMHPEELELAPINCPKYLKS